MGSEMVKQFSTPLEIMLSPLNSDALNTHITAFQVPARLCWAPGNSPDFKQASGVSGIQAARLVLLLRVSTSQRITFWSKIAPAWVVPGYTIATAVQSSIMTMQSLEGIMNTA